MTWVNEEIDDNWTQIDEFGLKNFGHKRLQTAHLYRRREQVFHSSLWWLC